MKWSQVANPIRLVSLAWIAVVGLGLAVGIQVLTSPWVYERVTHGGESAVAPGVWFVIDCLLVIWLHAPQLAFFVLALAAWATWRVVVHRNQLLQSSAARGLAIAGALISSLGAVVLAVILLPSVFGLLLGAMCETLTFERAASPDGRYVAVVAEVDCGAMSSSHRQVRVTRRLFPWASTSLLYFREHPVLHLSWSGRTLTISGDRTLGSMDHPPPDPMMWGGMLARYSGPKE